MLPVTQELREFCTKSLGLAADASEADVRASATGSLASGKLSIEELTKLTTTKATAAETRIAALVEKALAPTLAKLAPAAAAHVPESATVGLLDKALSIGATQAVEPTSAEMARKALTLGAGTSPNTTQVRVKSPIEQYSTARTAAMYDMSANPILKKRFSGQQVHNGWGPTGGVDGAMAPRPMDLPSKADLAITGAWFKFMCRQAAASSGRRYRDFELNDHEKQLVEYALHELEFTGPIGLRAGSDSGQFELKCSRLDDMMRKALLDDTTSGGQYAAPIVFDDAVILTPLLSGELFPLVNLVNVARGQRIQGFTLANPSVTWGAPEGTEVQPFDTTSFIGAFNTTIYEGVGAMLSGIYFEEDSPVNIGATVQQRFGEAMKADLDRVVALGNGTNEPLGALNTSGLATVTTDNNTSGPPTIGDYLSLLFSITKAFRNEAEKDRVAFIGNDTTYFRSRRMYVNPNKGNSTGNMYTTAYVADNRLLLGTNVEDYTVVGHPYKVATAVGNSTCGVFNLGRYRMYRRMGVQTIVEEGGKELRLANERLILIRFRFGGQLELAGAGASSSTFQS